MIKISVLVLCSEVKLGFENNSCYLVRSAVEEGERDGEGQERTGGSGRQHRQRASHPHQTGETSCLPPHTHSLSRAVFDVSALINSEIAHLTSIRARGSPGSSNQIIRRSRGKGCDCHSLHRSFSRPLFFPVFFTSLRPSTSCLSLLSKPLLLLFLSS